MFLFNYRQTGQIFDAAVAAAAAAAAAARQTASNDANGLPHQPIYRNDAACCPRFADSSRNSAIVRRCFGKLQKLLRTVVFYYNRGLLPQNKNVYYKRFYFAAIPKSFGKNS